MAWLLAVFILLLELAVGLNRNGLKSSRIFVPKAVNCDNMPVTSSGLAKENFARIAKFVGSTVVLGGLLRSNSARATDSSDLFANVECSDSIILLEQPNTKRKVILIGTAHISDESVKLVRRVIGSTRPDTVMIELDTKRIGRATDDVNLEDLGFITPTFDDASATAVGATAEIAGSRDGGRKSIVQSTLRKVVAPIQNAVQGLAGALLGKALGQFYNSVEKLGFTAGGEFRAAVEEGRKLGAKILLGDRNVDITLQRLAAAVSAVDPTKLAAVADRLSVLEDEMGLSLTPSASTGIEKVSCQFSSKRIPNQLCRICFIITGGSQQLRGKHEAKGSSEPTHGRYPAGIASGVCSFGW